MQTKEEGITGGVKGFTKKAPSLVCCQAGSGFPLHFRFLLLISWCAEPGALGERTQLTGRENSAIRKTKGTGLSGTDPESSSTKCRFIVTYIW